MRVLVACEFSGAVREAFRRMGHDATSCDLLETEVPGPHYVGPVEDILDDGWDLMVAHPPCTHLASSGARWWPKKQAEQRDAIAFFLMLMEAPIPRIAVENPVGIIGRVYREPDQIIQPFHHGHPEWKSTCLWLKNLPLLRPTNIVQPEEVRCGGKKPGRITSRIHRLPPSPDRWRERSRTYPGIAEAMAVQWGLESVLPPLPWCE